MAVTRRPLWICLGATDDMHPWCPFETADRREAFEHGLLAGHYCVNSDNTEERA